MKRVLFVSDYFTHGGLETRILDLVDFYQRHGIESFLVCDTLEPEHRDKFMQVMQLPLLSTDFNTIVQNTDKLVAFCRDNEIDMIDCQPLYCLISTILASSVLHLSMSYTSHSLFTFPPAKDVLNPLFYSLLELKRPQIFFVADYLLDLYGDKFAGCRADIVRNGVSLANLPKLKAGHSNKWAYAARLSPEKTQPLLDSLQTIEKSGVSELDVFGDGECRELLEEYITKHTDSKLKINLRGWCSDVQSQLADGGYTGFFGIDRAAIEAMAIGLPVIILGIDGLGPVVNEKTFEKLLPLNMASVGAVEEKQVLSDIAKVHSSPEKYDVRKLVKKHLDSEQIWSDYLNLVEKIPVDLGRDSMIEFWWEKFYKSVLLERTVSDQEKQISDLTQQLEDSYFRRVAKKLRGVTKR